MTKTLNFGVVFLFLKGGDVTAGSAAGSGVPYRPGTSQEGALSVRPERRGPDASCDL